MPDQWVLVQPPPLAPGEITVAEHHRLMERARPRRWEYPMGGAPAIAEIRTLDRVIKAIRSVLPEGEYQFVAPYGNRVLGDVEVAHITPFGTASAGWTSMMPAWPFQYRTVTSTAWDGYPRPVLYVR